MYIMLANIAEGSASPGSSSPFFLSVRARLNFAVYGKGVRRTSRPCFVILDATPAGWQLSLLFGRNSFEFI